MLTRTLPTLLSSATLRAGAVSALFCAAMLVSAPSLAAAKQDSVENRISSLHKSLKITADEESAWTAVAQTMRDNEAAMQKLVESRNAEQMQKVNAVEDLKIYEGFTQAHVDGLKKLISSFETLYQQMPDPQKAIADQVFQEYGHKGKSAHK
jgi:hypothetical protein